MIEENVSASDAAVSTIVRGNTGRTLSYLTPDEESEDLLVRRWFACESEDQFARHSVRKAFEKALRDAPKVDSVLHVYRGRPFDSDKDAPSSFEFGPPSSRDAKAGRYNRDGESFLYLSTSSAGVHAELSHHYSDGPTFYYQRFSIDCVQFAVADLTAESLPNILHLTFDMSERVHESARYFTSQVICEIVGACGFSGMFVPGVRGSPKNRYSNLVVFSTEDQWRSWVNSDSVPKRL
jgi:hypothetical protein